MSGLNKELMDILGIEYEFLLIILGLLFYYFKILSTNTFFITNIILVSFSIALYDVFLKKILLLNVNNDYHKFIINNVITIVTIDLLINLIRDYTNPKLNFMNYFNIAIGCIFYETIVFKLYNYNDMCNKRLKNITKTILRLATIHILSNFLNGNDYDQTWFDFSFGQIFNFALFETVFSEKEILEK